MFGGELVSHLRTDVLRDTAEPYLWSDEYFYRMLNEAQRQFARRTYCIMTDSLEIVTDEPVDNGNGVLVGNAVYELPKEVLFVWSIQINWQPQPLANWTRRRLPTISNTALGMPSVFIMDENIRHVRFYPTPDGFGLENSAAGPYTMYARCSLRPTADIDETSEPQIPEEYHMDLCDFVAWKALTLPDEDVQNLKVAQDYKANWLERLSVAKGEVYYRMLGPNAYATQNWTLANNTLYGSGFAIR
jgi:hypothetical protein